MTVLSDENHNQLSLSLSEDILKEISFTKSKQILKFVVQKAQSAIAVVDRQLRYLMLSQQWLQDYNLSVANLIDPYHHEVLSEQFCQEKKIYQDCLNQGISQEIEQIIINQKGITQKLKLSIYPWYDERKQIEGLIIFSQILEEHLLATEPFFDISLDLLCVTGLDGYFKRVNPALIKALRYSTSELIAQPFLSFVHPEDLEITLMAIEKLNQGMTSVQFENRYCCQDGSYLRLQWVATRPQANSGLIYAVAKDITQSYELQQKLLWQSKYDPLTGLLNRHEFEQQINEIIVATQIHKKQHAFCYLDLDRFKVINDICGHLIGDKLLLEITSLIKEEIKEINILARLGGDEFGILLQDCSLAEAEAIAHLIRKKIKKIRFKYQEKNFFLGVSIGIVAINENSLNFSNLLTAADTACYAAKEQGRNWVRIYSAEEQEFARQIGDKNWISKLNLALEENHFCLYCQKITPLQEHIGVEHYEILLRLLDLEGNVISPMAFIPAAERYDLMPSIDRWVISTFFASYQNYCQSERSASASERIYTINLSGASINSEQFFEFLKKQFANYNVAPQNICFEITETTAIANLTKAATFINEIKELGCSIALDDFGSGMSSLTYLKTLPIDYLKIDGNFVKNIVNDPVDRATVECFNRIGEVMKIQTIAEFVENDEIIAQLKEIGVNYAQGYGIDKPAPLCF
jgi:diguanylate cyclase (GGDEF)-like protein/PAS domain S-box-containing protein